jgi:hypothetical protein
MIANPYAGVAASPVQPVPKRMGLSAAAVRSNVMPPHETKKFANDCTVESYVKDPEVGATPDVVVKFIVYSVIVSAHAEKGTEHRNKQITETFLSMFFLTAFFFVAAVVMLITGKRFGSFMENLTGRCYHI